MAVTIRNDDDARRWLQSLPAKLRFHNRMDAWVVAQSANVERMSPAALTQFRAVEAEHADNARQLASVIEQVKEAAQRARVKGDISEAELKELMAVGLGAVFTGAIIVTLAIAAAVVAFFGWRTVASWASTQHEREQTIRRVVSSFESLPAEQRGLLVDVLDTEAVRPTPAPGGGIASGLSAAAMLLVVGLVVVMFTRQG
jgi:hypothetical protein